MDGAGFTIDLGEITPINSLQIIWGSEAGGAATAAEDRRPAKFKVQVSNDGLNWRNFDHYTGGEVDTGWFGVRQAEPAPGTEEYAGFDISNEVPGPVATVKVSWADREDFPIKIPVTQNARYVRFESTKRRMVEQQGNRIVPTRVREFRIYKETIQEVEQSMMRTYTLDPSKADLTFRADVHNYGSEASDLTINGVITPGSISFSKTITLPGNTSQEVTIDGIALDNPKLWWSNTYGEQPLYTAEVNLSVSDVVQDRTSFKFDAREFTYPIDGNRMTVYRNSIRILAKGGN
jgi:hypothetical protein